MLDINVEDVLAILEQSKPVLVFLGIGLLIALVVAIAVKGQPKAKKRFARIQAAIAAVLVVVVSLNTLLMGSMASIITLATSEVHALTDGTIQKASELAEDIADNGVVLLKNEGNELPLATNKLNVFGWASTNPVYGGTGSGSMNDQYDTTTLLEGLTEAGFELNDELSDFYTSYRAESPERVLNSQDWTLPEPPAASYGNVLDDAKEFSDTALVVIARGGGENFDLPQNMDGMTYENNSTEYADFEPGQSWLELTHTEQDLIDMVSQNFEHVVVLYNGSNAMELGFVDRPEIDAALWFPGAGQTGFASLGRVLTGEVNPSGRTTDTFVYDLASAPWWNNFGSFYYDNAQDFVSVDRRGNEITPAFVNYVEGIYVGYKFYETASDEGLIDYEQTVQFPFGYGLSYTTFEQTMGDVVDDGQGNLSVDVTVTNTGSVAGREAVQLYYNPPYTNGGVEKATANLLAIDKTELLSPGASETVTLTWSVEDMASYDSSAADETGAYVLDAGDYTISVNDNSHVALDERTYTVPETVTYDAGSTRSTDKVAAENQFESAEGELTYLSRADHFANYDEAIAAPTTHSMTDEQKATFRNTGNYNPAEDADPNAEMPVTEAKNGARLYDLRGKDYDDPAWDTLLDQLSVEDMNTLVGNGGYQTAEIASVDKVRTSDVDGPAALNNNFTGQGSIGFPPATTIACTWDLDLADAYGDMIGQMAEEMDVAGWYAPAMNIHRTAFAGRNFEYYSEDGMLSGLMAARVEAAAYDHGVYGYIKHFALNDQETNRYSMLCTWSNEQAIREVYLKPFEMAVKQGNAHAVMTSYNYIGTTWAGANENLLVNVLRNEWGYHGVVLTDYLGRPYYMNSDAAVRNGGGLALCTVDMPERYVNELDATGVQGLRNAAHDTLFTVVNSRAYATDVSVGALAPWQMGLIAADVVIVLALAGWEVAAVRKFRRAGESA